MTFSQAQLNGDVKPLITVLGLGVWCMGAGLVLAHAGHGDEFHSGGSSNSSVRAVRVDGETAQRLGLKVEPVKRQKLALGIKATGQIETLPNQRVEVTTPVRGTVTQLLVKPGDRVQAGQSHCDSVEPRTR